MIGLHDGAIGRYEPRGLRIRVPQVALPKMRVTLGPSQVLELGSRDRVAPYGSNVFARRYTIPESAFMSTLTLTLTLILTLTLSSHLYGKRTSPHLQKHSKYGTPDKKVNTNGQNVVPLCVEVGPRGYINNTWAAMTKAVKMGTNGSIKQRQGVTASTSQQEDYGVDHSPTLGSTELRE